LSFFLSLILFSGCNCGETYDFDETADKELAIVNVSDVQWTGVAVSGSGRIFASYPNHSPSHTISVAELTDTTVVKVYPDESWNRWSTGMNAEEHFISVQSIFIDRAGFLWILDSGNPQVNGKHSGVVQGGAKLLQVDLAKNNVIKTIKFNPPEVTALSMLSDVRIDEKREIAYITDSYEGALLVVDLRVNRTRRLLAADASTKSDNVNIVVDGNPFTSETGQSSVVHIKSLSLTPDGGWLYWRALTGQMLYRVNTDFLLNESLSASGLSAAVEKVEVKFLPASDGMIMGPDGTLYVASMEMHAILGVRNNTFFRVKQNKSLLHWPSSFSIANGFMYVVNSQPDPNGSMQPYKMFKFRIPVPKG